MARMRVAVVAAHVARRESVRQLALTHFVRQGLRRPQAVIYQQSIAAPRVGFQVVTPCRGAQRRLGRHRPPLPSRRAFGQMQDQRERRHQLVESPDVASGRGYAMCSCSTPALR